MNIDPDIIVYMHNPRPNYHCFTPNLVLFCREREKNKDKKDLEKAFVEEFKLKREEWKQKERERLEQENREIARFASLQADREQARQAAKKEQEESRAHVQQGVSVYI